MCALEILPYSFLVQRLIVGYMSTPVLAFSDQYVHLVCEEALDTIHDGKQTSSHLEENICQQLIE